MISVMTASDICMVIWTVATALGVVINAVGVYALIYVQLKYRKANDPPIDIAKQLADLRQAHAENTSRLDQINAPPENI